MQGLENARKEMEISDMDDIIKFNSLVSIFEM